MFFKFQLPVAYVRLTAQSGYLMVFMDLMLLVFFIMAFLAATLSAIAGFGSALILISASSLIFDIKWSIAITTFFYFYNTSLKTYYFRAHICWPLVFKLSLLAIPGVFIGSYTLLSINSAWLSYGLAFMSLLYLCLDVFKLIPRYKVHDGVLVLTGLVYGFISGVFGSGSIIKALVFKQLNLSKEAFVASMAASALPLNLIKLAVFMGASILAPEDALHLITLLLSGYFGTRLGRIFLLRLNQEKFDLIVRLTLFILSASLIFKTLS